MLTFFRVDEKGSLILRDPETVGAVEAWMWLA